MKLHKTVKIYPNGDVDILLGELNKKKSKIIYKWEVIIVRVNEPPNRGWVVSEGPLNFVKDGDMVGRFYPDRKDAIEEAKRLIAFRREHGIP